MDKILKKVNNIKSLPTVRQGHAHTLIRRVRISVSFAKAKGGFTLIETMVALTIITFAILGPISLATYSIKTSTTSKNNVIASFLAQDAMEYIRNWRDSNHLQGENWLNQLQGPCGSGCHVDTTLLYDKNDTNNAIWNCPAGNCDPLKYDDVLKEYNYTSGVNTIFTRKYMINENVNEQEAKVTITVSWEDKFGERSFEMEGHLFNWQ